MDSVKVYGVCDNNCKFPVFTQEQVLSILWQAINDKSLQDVVPEYAAIKKLIDINGGEDVKIWTGTEAEYNALDPKPVVSRAIPRRGLDGTIYICIDDTGLSALPTEPIPFDLIDRICI